MPSHQNILAVTLSVLALGSLLNFVNSSPGPAERIANASIIKNLNDKSGCVAAIVLDSVIPLPCNENGEFYIQECTAAVIGRKTLLTSANCIRNVMELADIGFKRFNFFYPQKYPLIILGSTSLFGADVAAAGVSVIPFQESFLQFHPDYNGSSHDLVAIKSETEIPASVCPQPFFIPSKVQNELTYAGPFVMSWGEPVCTGLAVKDETYSMAKRTSVCSNEVDGFSDVDDQICVSLKRVQDNTVKPKAAQGDPGSPIYVSVSSGENGNVAKYILSGILGLFPKSDPLLYPDPYGEGCSKTSVVPVVNLLDRKNMAFLNDLAAQQKDIMKSPIPDQIPASVV